jgi:hypothetical protein
MEGFWALDYHEENEPFVRKFYDCLEGMQETNSQKYVQSFFYQMLPRIMIEDWQIVKLISIKSQVADTNVAWANVL